MKVCKIVSGIFFLLSLLMIFSSAAMAAGISYSLTDLSSQQENLWQIDYQVSDFDSDLYDDLVIYFEYGQFESISLIASLSSWDTHVANPDIVFGVEEDGYLDAQVASPGGVLRASFSVQVIYLGDDMPGDQYFELYSSSNWETVGSGMTSAVPVPGGFVLMLSGLAGLAACRRQAGNHTDN